ncbi:dihydrofolate reductase [Varibaculum vaginae]|uniref:dihydrofolate reductase n=1 Tax=Varibaculum vaginae TaxID=2364797 RepID=UPI003F695945
MKIGMIWAQAAHRVIGDGQKMLWHVPADFKHFKATTMGSPIIMGRRSFEALGKQPLPGRLNIVLTSQEGYQAEGAQIASSLSQATQLAATSGAEICWITGGARLYEEGMRIADELAVTYLDLDVGDHPEYAHAPQISPQLWQVNEERSDSEFRPISGDCRWKLVYYQKMGVNPN